MSVFPEFVAVQRKASTAEAGGKGAAARQNATSARPCVLPGRGNAAWRTTNSGKTGNRQLAA